MISIGSDHGGFELKEELVKFLKEEGYDVKDEGTYSKASCDHPDFGEAVGNEVAKGNAKFGIVICTTGVGISMSANKVKGVRASPCRDVDCAFMTRKDNDANVLGLGAKYVSLDEAKEIVKTFLTTEFVGLKPGEERHKRRVDKIIAIEEKNFK